CVLHAGPGVVHAAPPPAFQRGQLIDLRPAEIAELALQACEVAAALHAAGVAGLPFTDWNPRLARDEGSGRPFVHWMVPVRSMGPPLFTYPLPSARRFGPPFTPVEEPPEGVELLADPVKHDLWGLVHFFFTLLPEAALAQLLGAVGRFLGLMPDLGE